MDTPRHGGQHLTDSGQRPRRTRDGLSDGGKIAGLGRVTLGADKGYDQNEMMRELREHD
jgi:hypothetical protein